MGAYESWCQRVDAALAGWKGFCARARLQATVRRLASLSEQSETTVRYYFKNLPGTDRRRLPKDVTELGRLVDALLKHVVDEAEAEESRQQLFEAWNACRGEESTERETSEPGGPFPDRAPPENEADHADRPSHGQSEAGSAEPPAASCGTRLAVTVLNADICGYSMRVSRDTPEAKRASDAAKASIAQQIAAHGGSIADVTGDCVLSTFKDATSAVTAAVAIQSRSPNVDSGDLPRERIQWRIGLDMGDVLIDDKGALTGNAVNVSARIQADAIPGTASVSDAVRRAAIGHLQDVEFVEPIQRTFKNIPEVTTVWRVSVQTSQTDKRSSDLYIRWFLESQKSATQDEFDRFVSLTLTKPPAEREEDLLRSRGPSNSKGAPDPQSLSELFARDPDAIGWVLVGDPGSGKTTLLKEHVHRCAAALLSGEDRELCIYIGLNAYTAGPGQLDPWTWLNDRWQAGWRRDWGPLPKLEELASTYRVRLLLDGLNEINASERDHRSMAVGAFRAWLATASSQHGLLPPLFTVRTLDHNESLGQARQAQVQPIDRQNIAPFIEKRLGADGVALHAAIFDTDDALARRLPRQQGQPEGDRLLKLYTNPYNLALQCDLYRLALKSGVANPLEAVFDRRADLITGMLALRLRRCVKDSKESWVKDLALLTDGDRSRFLSDGLDRLAPRGGPLRLEGGLLRGLGELAFDLHRSSNGGKGRLLGAEAEIRSGLPADRREAWFKALLSLGILAPPAGLAAPGEHEFSHHLLQEYFAACHIVDRQGNVELPAEDLVEPPVSKPWVGDDGRVQMPRITAWQECLLMAAGWCRPDAVETLVDRVLALENLSLAGCLLAATSGLPQLDTRRDALRASLLRRMEDQGSPLPRRWEAGQLLGDLGDDTLRYVRPPEAGGRCLVPRPEHWAVIPAGKYLIGDNKREATLKHACAIAYAPVTNAEFACFIEDGGYGATDAREPPAWWGTKTDPWAAASRAYWAEGWRDEGWKISGRERGGHLTQPDYWGLGEFSNPLQPVVGVSWYEAMAYCRWLESRWGVPRGCLRLPTDLEWEAAARGLEGYAYPWGDAEPSRKEPRLNFDLMFGRTTPVGLFPEGRPYADEDDRPLAGRLPVDRRCLRDLAGQVWEWSMDRYKAGSEDMALRGGSWFSLAVNCRAAFRFRYHPGYRDDYLGFRLCVCPICEP